MSGFVSLAAVVIVAVLIFLVLFEPTVAYRARRAAARIDSREFVNYLSAIVNARPLHPGEVRVLNHGDDIFGAELRAIREAGAAFTSRSISFCAAGSPMKCSPRSRSARAAACACG